MQPTLTQLQARYLDLCDVLERGDGPEYDFNTLRQRVRDAETKVADLVESGIVEAEHVPPKPWEPHDGQTNGELHLDLCPKCNAKLEKESDSRPTIEGPGSFFVFGVSRHFDEWSMIDRRCPKCRWVR